MKKKIIYISGAEIFDVNDVRTAFEEVRAVLKLDKDTILFGVPVDAENVCENPVIDENLVNDCTINEPECLNEDDCVCEGFEENTQTETKETELKAENVSEIVDETSNENEQINTVSEKENTPQSIVSQQDFENKDETVVPILSVLAAKTPSESKKQDEPIRDEKTNIDVKIEHSVTVSAGFDNVSDMINDDMPVAQTEKTLEELLESMTPLQEDIQPEYEKSDETETVQAKTNEIDITLENLASEFAENQDKIVPQKKTSERGKIGKLKNILPFKKTKRDDSGIMGDLFGWAGVAANDDDFSMPGFFTNAK